MVAIAKIPNVASLLSFTMYTWVELGAKAKEIPLNFLRNFRPMSATLIYMTCKDREEAIRISQVLVQEKWVACTNLLPSMTSVYWWNGEVVQDEEVVLLAKTDDALLKGVIQCVKELHSYVVPCIISLPIENGNPDYLQWIQESLGPQQNTPN